MPIQELAPPTLQEVVELISQLENQYQITSSEFLNAGEHIPEDEASEWKYLLQQREVLSSEALLKTVFAASIKFKQMNILYGATEFLKRGGSLEDEQQSQYDCAA